VSLVLRSSKLQQAGFRHGFSLRTGGVSEAPYDSLNLARNLADPGALENHRRLAREVGYVPSALYEVSQVHGNVVLGADPHVPAAEFRQREGDALWARQRDLAVGIRTADCVPILLASPDSGAVAAVHAGWRGLVAHVISESVAALCAAARVEARTLIAAIGPHISRDAFEVSHEVAQQIAACAAHDSQVIVPRAPRPYVDLARVVCAQLKAAGMAADHIEQVPGCTFQDSQHFFSFRRDGQASGRHLAVIVAGC
jgi:polyphenol oxidase